jgi:hypothetical protein
MPRPPTHQSTKRDREAKRLSRRAADRFVIAAEIVVHDVQRHGRCVIISGAIECLGLSTLREAKRPGPS